jgi:hypothetical protein
MTSNNNDRNQQQHRDKKNQGSDLSGQNRMGSRQDESRDGGKRADREGQQGSQNLSGNEKH